MLQFMKLNLNAQASDDTQFCFDEMMHNVSMAIAILKSISPNIKILKLSPKCFNFTIHDKSNQALIDFFSAIPKSVKMIDVNFECFADLDALQLKSLGKALPKDVKLVHNGSETYDDEYVTLEHLRKVNKITEELRGYIEYTTYPLDVYFHLRELKHSDSQTPIFQHDLAMELLASYSNIAPKTASSFRKAYALKVFHLDIQSQDNNSSNKESKIMPSM